MNNTVCLNDETWRYQAKERDLFLTSFYGKKITAAKLVGDDAVVLAFEDLTAITIRDAGQCCCEHRYITTDDDLQSLVGHLLIRIEARPGPDIYADHETMFVEIATEVGFVTLTTHNEHNGYYGGFSLTVSAE